MRITIFLSLCLLMTGCLSRRPKIGDVYLQNNGEDKFQVLKIIDIKNDKIFLCVYTGTDIINEHEYGACDDHNRAHQYAFMTEDEKNDVLHGYQRYRARFPDISIGLYTSDDIRHFVNGKPVYLKNVKFRRKIRKRRQIIGTGIRNISSIPDSCFYRLFNCLNYSAFKQAKLKASLKSGNNLDYVLALYFFYYNFCRIHKSLRCAPAMQAGIKKTIGELKDLLK